MPIKQIKQPQGIGQLFPLLGEDSRYDYHFGFFTKEDSPGCHFRISFNKNSELYASGVAECINEETDSRELREFCLQYGLAKKKHQLEKTISVNNTKATVLADLMASPEGSIDMILL